MAINVDNFLYSWPRILLAVVVVMLIKAGPLRSRAALQGDPQRRGAHRAAPPAGRRVRLRAFRVRLRGARTVAVRDRARRRHRHRHHGANAVHRDARTLRLTPEEREELEEDSWGRAATCWSSASAASARSSRRCCSPRASDATILDIDAETRAAGSAVRLPHYFGDGTRRDVLRAAGAEQATIICICVDKPDVANRIVDLVMAEFPSAKVYVRSWDRGHTLELLGKGVDYEMRRDIQIGARFRRGDAARHRRFGERSRRNRRRRPAPRRRPTGRAAKRGRHCRRCGDPAEGGHSGTAVAAGAGAAGRRARGGGMTASRAPPMPAFDRAPLYDA